MIWDNTVMLPEPVSVTLKVIQVFEKLNIPYFIGGSMASAVHGIARATMDVDIVAHIQLSQVDQMLSLLKNEFYIEPEMVKDSIQTGTSFNMIHLETMFKVDIFLLKKRPFDQNQMARRISQSISDDPDKRVYISSPEDIILAKLEWYRDGGEVSDRQWQDILGIVSLRKAEINLEYLQRWAKDLQVYPLLERALKEAA